MKYLSPIRSIYKLLERLVDFVLLLPIFGSYNDEITIKNFISDLDRLIAIDEQEALDHIYIHLFDWQFNGKLKRCDLLLSRIKFDGYGLVYLMALASITRPNASILKHRPKFVHDLRSHLSANCPESVDCLPYIK